MISREGRDSRLLVISRRTGPRPVRRSQLQLSIDPMNRLSRRISVFAPKDIINALRLPTTGLCVQRPFLGAASTENKTKGYEPFLHVGKY